MRRLLLFFFLFFVLGNIASAQLTGGEIFLPGHWLEIGQNAYGAFGANPPPGGYHPYPAGTNLAEVYDYGHDGWTSGAPPLMGDYTYPGSPYEGWGIQVNGTGGLNWAFTSTGAISGTGTLTGNNTTYVNAGGKLIGNWAGTAAGGQLRLNMETRVDTNASWVVCTVKMYNTGATTLNNLYYFRGCDPDNDEAHGGSFATNNYVNYQNDADHRVGVSGAGETYTYAYLQLCTKDCRAKALVHESWPINYSVTDLSTVYTGTAAITPYYNVGVDHPGDIAIGLVYQIGNLCPGDSTFVSYAYTFLNAATGIDSAFPEPTIVVNGVPANPPAAPAAIYDTFNACLYPGLTTLPVNLSGAAGSGVWTWSTWTWSPGTGLATTTGLVNNINLNSLPPSITYTITGTAYNSCGGTGGGSCGTRIIYLTVLTCNGATVNSPCIGQPLDFNAPGDSTGATYVWYGPAPSTATVATTQSFTINPSVWADTGMYHVIKTVAGTHDTSSTVVVLHPKPNTFATSNSPLCIGAANTLTLFDSTDVGVATYAWSGPAGFTSAIQDPTIPGFSAADTGIYNVIVTTAFGCKDTANTHVVLLPPPGAPIVTDPLTYCYGATFVPFTVTPATGATVYFYSSAAGGGATTTHPTVNTSAPGTYTYYFGQTIGLCESPIDSIVITVYPPILPSFTYAIHHGCTQDTVYLTNTSTGATSDMWNFGDGTATSTATNPTHIYLTQGIFSVKLTDYFATCSNSVTENIDTRHTVQAAFMAVLDTICAGQISNMVNLSTATVGVNPGVITTYAWNFNDGSTDATKNPGHTFTEAGIYNVNLTVTDSIGCQSSVNHDVYVIRLDIRSWLDTTLCLRQPLPMTNEVLQYPPLGLTDYTYYWSPATNLSSNTVQVPFFNAFGSYTYTLTVSLLGDWGACTQQDVMVVNSVLGQPLTNVTPDVTVTYGTSVQLNADNEVYYWWVPDNGSLNNTNINDPVANPHTSTVYTVYGMDKYGCVDSAFVNVTVDSSMHECIPSGFTPNNDGLNDYFHPIGLIFQNLVDFRVYNRWGQQVFYTSSADSKGWDGTYNGVLQDMGVYYYTIIVARPGGSGENIVYKGDITLIR